MNTLNALQMLYADMKANATDCFNHPDPIVLSQLSSRVQDYAQRLKELKEEEIQDLIVNGPKISGDSDNPIITLMRDGKAKHYRIGEYMISVAKTDEEWTCEKLKIVGEPDSDGFWHFIYARGSDYGEPSFGIWLYKEEALILKKALKALDDEDDKARGQAKCLFCGEKKFLCGQDHASEMREAMRNADIEDDRRRGY